MYLCWTGLTLMLVSPVFGLGKPFVIAGAIVLMIGVILGWLGR
jgi:hypothetical protein